MFCRYTGQATGLGVRTLRLYSVYGPWEEPTRLMPTLVMRGLAGELPGLVSPATARDYIYVDDVVDACLAAAAAPGQEPGAVYNVGTGRQTSLREVVELVRAEMGITAEPVWGSMAPRSWDTDVWVADSGQIRAQLGWQPSHALPEGFRLLVGWLRDQPEIQEFYASFSR
jgi:dolichol-phosphate mannosyltransferase